MTPEEAEAHLRSFAEEVAEHDCDYGDGCPLFPKVKLNHYRCLSCRAREVLETCAKITS